MSLKLLLAIISFGVFMLHFIGWRKTGLQFAGNELILLPLSFPLMMFLPGIPQVCTVRLAVFSSVFGLYVLFGAMPRKGKGVYLPVFAYTAAAIFIYELVSFMAGREAALVVRGYKNMNLCLWVMSCVWMYCHTVKSGNLKNTVSIRKVLVHVFAFVVFTVLSGIAFCAALAYPAANFLQYVFMVLLWGANMWYLHYEKPDYMAGNRNDGGISQKMRPYASGKIPGYGQIIEDEGMDVADEGIVEDSRIIYALMSLFEKERLYLNVDVKIANVALMIGTNKTYLSRALNTRLSKNFCQFVNYYRIKEVCALYIDNPELEIRELAEQCGFNSASNFSIVFKYNTGFTPGDWCRIIKQKIENNETIFVDDYIL